MEGRGKNLEKKYEVRYNQVQEIMQMDLELVGKNWTEGGDVGVVGRHCLGHENLGVRWSLQRQAM